MTERLYEDEPNLQTKQEPHPFGWSSCFSYCLLHIRLRDGGIQLIGGGVRRLGLFALGAALRLDALCQQKEQHQQGCAAGAEGPDGELCQDFKHFGFCVSVIILNEDASRIVRIVLKQACYSTTSRLPTPSGTISSKSRA